VIPREPSRTALAAAAHRAAHQLDGGALFRDPLAVRIVGEDAARASRSGGAAGMRWFIAARSRVAEDALAAAVGAGVRQLVVLGAGLDTYAYRGAHAAALRIFEVDHPATQAWKRARLHALAIEPPANLTFAPIDFEREMLGDALANAGFDAQQRAFFMWLGVVPYLTADAIRATLGFIADLPGGGDVVFDYGEPAEAFSGEERAAYDARAARLAAIGEPFVSAFKPDELRAQLSAIGFARIEDFSLADVLARYFPDRTASTRGRGHILHASTR
jgi:methyltransferase (TIGR00027 family)